MNVFFPEKKLFLINRVPLHEADYENLIRANGICFQNDVLVNQCKEVAIIIKALPPNVVSCTFSTRPEDPYSFDHPPVDALHDAIADAIKYPTINHVALDMPDLGDIALVLVAANIMGDPPLECLDIYGCGIGKYGVGTFASMLAANTTLKSLHLFNKKNREYLDISPFEETLKTNTTLQSLSVDQEWFNKTYSATHLPVVRGLNINKVLSDNPEFRKFQNSIPRKLISAKDILDFCKNFENGTELRQTMKLVVLGNGRIGKSTLVNYLKHCNTPKVMRIYKTLKDDPSKFAPSSTVGIEYSSIKVGKGAVTIFDFAGQLEYTVTHQYFLSSELIIYLVCFDLSEDRQHQIEQITYWLDYLHSLLANDSAEKDKWRIFIVGTRADLSKSTEMQHLLTSNPVPLWQQTWPFLPLHNEIFITSQANANSITGLLKVLKLECEQIMSKFSARVPKAYLSLLESLQSLVQPEQRPFIPMKDIKQLMPEERLLSGLKYLHAVGDIVILPNELVCVNVSYISNMMSNFISPESVQLNLPHIANGKVEILTSAQVGKVLQMKENDPSILEDLTVMSHFGICFPLQSDKGSFFMFPSLSKESQEPLRFSIEPSPIFQFMGMRFSTENKKVFVPGFFCKLIVEIFKRLNEMAQADFVQVHSNGVIIKCPGLLHGELLVMLEPRATSIVILLMATNPSLEYVVPVFREMFAAFPQYSNCIEQHLCPTCIETWVVKAKQSSTDIGTFTKESEDNNKNQFCTRMHAIADTETKPNPITAQNVSRCWTHFRNNHDIFINYRVATEGKQAENSSEPKRGMVEMVYTIFAPLRKKNGDPVYVFWDFKCLNFGQNWEKGFLHALLASKVIILLISQKVIEGIAKNAENHQDNVLIEYECAILQNKRHGIPVIPILIGEIEADDVDASKTKTTAFSFANAKQLLPDKPHIRGENGQDIINELSQPLNEHDKKFLGSISKTLEEISLYLCSYL